MSWIEKFKKTGYHINYHNHIFLSHTIESDQLYIKASVIVFIDWIN